jgi:hypothetical protein
LALLRSVKRNGEQGGRKKGKQRGAMGQSVRGLGFTRLSFVEDKKGGRLAGSVVVEKGGGAHAWSLQREKGVAMGGRGAHLLRDSFRQGRILAGWAKKKIV